MGITIIGRIESGSFLSQKDDKYYLVNIGEGIAQGISAKQAASYYNVGMFEQSNEEEERQAKSILSDDRRLF